MGSLRQWFNSTCSCDGYNNLYNPNLTCLDGQTGIITSTVHHDVFLSAQQLINLASSDMQMRAPPIVYLSHGWILCLKLNKTVTSDDDNDKSTFIGLSVLITVSVTGLCTILALILCITIGLVYIKYKR